MKNKILSLAFALLTLSACRTAVVGDPYYSAWFNIYGEGCSNSLPRPGCNYFSNGVKIMAWQDPFSYQWQPGTYWTSPTGIWYDPNGWALNAQQPSEMSTDVITQASEEDQSMLKDAAKKLSQEYALSESASIQIAKSLQDWSRLSKERTRTGDDIADFAERLYGIKADRIETALAKVQFSKSLQPIEELNVDVAAYWGTTPETSKQILKKWHEGELNQLLK